MKHMPPPPELYAINVNGGIQFIPIKKLNHTNYATENILCVLTVFI